MRATAKNGGSMQCFVDRKEDLETLEAQYASKEAAMVVIYGRRRVGKTALISEFIKGKNALYFLATEESEAQNRNAFQKLVAHRAGDALLEQASLDNWDIIFDRLTQDGERIVIALDEFQYLGKANAAFPSIFQRIWDEILSKRNVMVILCGSLVSLMESQVLSYSSPLYGRRTAQIHMRQIPYRHYKEFFPRNTAERDLVQLYSVTGGVPKYIESFRQPGDIYQAIQANILNRNSFLYDEPNFLLSKEVTEVGTYFSIIKAMAAGNRKSGDIAAAMNIKQTSLGKYLKTLEKLDIVERTVPVSETNPEKSRKGLYRIKDNYLRFWFRFMFPNTGLLETGHQAEVLAAIRHNFIDGHAAYVYENICRDKLWDLAAGGTLPFLPTKVGSWWGQGNVEIDVAAVNRETRQVAFGECKFWKDPVGSNVLRHLEGQVEKALRDTSLRAYDEKPTYVLFSIAGFTQELIAEAEERQDVVLAG